jgi:hypothetical protein
MQWCEDDETARDAELLYGHIDNMELYPGLQAECTKPPMPGSGVCPGQTTGRGILGTCFEYKPSLRHYDTA